MRARGLARATGSAPTTGVAVAIPDLATRVKLKFSADGYAGMGRSGTVPAATTANGVYIDAATIEYWDLDRDGGRGSDAFVYVWAVAATITYTISFYG